MLVRLVSAKNCTSSASRVSPVPFFPVILGVDMDLESEQDRTTGVHCSLQSTPYELIEMAQEAEGLLQGARWPCLFRGPTRPVVSMPSTSLETRRLPLPTLFGCGNLQPVPSITISHPELCSAALTPLDGVVQVVGPAFNKPRELTSTARRSRRGPSTDSRLFPSLETGRMNGSDQIDGVQTLLKR